MELSFAQWLEAQESELDEERLPDQTTQFMPVNQPFSDYASAVSMAKERQADFHSVLQNALQKGAKGQGEVMVLIKTEDSTANKMGRGKQINGITDILRGSIIIDGDPVLTKRVARALFGNTNYPVVKYDPKTEPRTGDRFGFFGSYNIDILVDGMACEVQVLTRKLFVMKHGLHQQVYTPYRHNPEQTPPDQAQVSRVKYTHANGPTPLEEPKLLKRRGWGYKGLRKQNKGYLTRRLATMPDIV
jgi:hypothetical protein